MNGDPKESDWKHFRSMVTDLRERYLQEKNQEILNILSAPDKTPTERFWDTYERMKKEKKILEECLDGHRRSQMTMFMMLMISHGMLTEKDLSGFSEELQGQMKRFLK